MNWMNSMASSSLTWRRSFPVVFIFRLGGLQEVSFKRLSSCLHLCHCAALQLPADGAAVTSDGIGDLRLRFLFLEECSDLTALEGEAGCLNEHFDVVDWACAIDKPPYRLCFR